MVPAGIIFEGLVVPSYESINTCKYKLNMISRNLFFLKINFITGGDQIEGGPDKSIQEMRA
jgi:hypothetical protein